MVFRRRFLDYSAGNDEPGKPDTVVVSERLWRRRYGASREVLGKQVLVNGSPHTIAGVMPVRALQAIRKRLEHSGAVLGRVGALPGVEGVSLSNALPPDRPGYHDNYEIEG